MQLPKAALVDRLIAVEQAYADREDCWLRANDEALTSLTQSGLTKPAVKAADSIIAIPPDSTSNLSPRQVDFDSMWAEPATIPQGNALDECRPSNYFNYFTEIEEVFIRRRGKHLWLSPMDWALMESWKEQGVPLHVVLRAVGQVFDKFDANPRRRSVKSLMYCQEEVEAQFTEWRDRQVGAGVESQDRTETVSSEEAYLPFPRETIIQHLTKCRESLLRMSGGQEKEFIDALEQAASSVQHLQAEFARTVRPDVEKLEASLVELESLLDRAARERLAPRQLATRRIEVEEQLRNYRPRLAHETYEQMVNNLLVKRLREEYGIPRLSLFYL
ncbi:MAG: hypothetical protein DMF64_00510 [Acidobacteria bacterium]|nr:MAG: hypothetical protein DMF64_00510 [Acidobacteriota bacterium]